AGSDMFHHEQLVRHTLLLGCFPSPNIIGHISTMKFMVVTIEFGMKRIVGNGRSAPRHRIESRVVAHLIRGWRSVSPHSAVFTLRNATDVIRDDGVSVRIPRTQ